MLSEDFSDAFEAGLQDRFGAFTPPLFAERIITDKVELGDQGLQGKSLLDAVNILLGIVDSMNESPTRRNIKTC